MKIKIPEFFNFEKIGLIGRIALIGLFLILIYFLISFFQNNNVVVQEVNTL